MRSASNIFRKETAISSNTGGRKRAGISSVPISNSNSFAMAVLVEKLSAISYQRSAFALSMQFFKLCSAFAGAYFSYLRSQVVFG
jgi:hypothetical protein